MNKFNIGTDVYYDSELFQVSVLATTPATGPTYTIVRLADGMTLSGIPEDKLSRSIEMPVPPVAPPVPVVPPTKPIPVP
jgi:hypothetical protein